MPERKRKTTPARQTKKKKSGQVREIHSPEASTLSGATFRTTKSIPERRGAGPAAAGQAGDIQGVPRRPRADSESVEELLEEGQTREAGIVSGVENALDPDQGEVRTHETLNDDVPPEYTDRD